MDNIATLAGKFKTSIELQTYCDAQYTALTKAYERIGQLEGEIKHLQGLLTSTAPLVENKSELIIKSTEQVICEMEIERLKQTAMNRILTLEETKRFDLLVKNLYLSRGDTKDLEVDFTQLPPGITEATLLKIASIPDVKVEENV